MRIETRVARSASLSAGVVAQGIPPPGNPDDNPEEFEEEEEPAAWLARLNLEWRLRTILMYCKGEVSVGVRFGTREHQGMTE